MRKTRFVAVLAALVGANPIWAAPPASSQLPTGGQVVAGAVTLAPSGSSLTVTQTTGRGIINWQTFSIGSGAQVVFVQPGSQSATLNRVLSAEPSAIYGQLSANGQIYLINPNGIVVGPSGQINANGLTLSTSDIADGDFLAGATSFSPIEGGRISIDGSVTGGAGGLTVQSSEMTVSAGASLNNDGGQVLVNPSSSLTISGSIRDLVTIPTTVTRPTAPTFTTPVTITTAPTITIATAATIPTMGTIPNVQTTSGAKETSRYSLSGESFTTPAGFSPSLVAAGRGAFGSAALAAVDGAVTVQLDLVTIQTD